MKRAYVALLEAFIVLAGMLMPACGQLAAGPAAEPTASTQPATAVPATPSPTPIPTATPSPTPAPTPSPTPAPTSADVSLVFAGDIMFHPQTMQLQRDKQSGRYDFSTFFENVAPVLQQADFAIGNLEAPVWDVKKSRIETLRFAAPPEAVTDLKNAGFDVLTTANNHAMDQGFPALANTIQAIEGGGMLTTGTYRNAGERDRICMLEKDGVKIAILAYTRHTNRSWRNNQGMGVNIMDTERAKADAARARAAGADAVILCAHFGKEYAHSANAVQRNIVNAMREAGVTAVVGAHPHVLQPVAADPGGKFFAAYSLGNAVTYTNSKDRQYSALLKLTVRKDFSTGAVTISGISFIPTWSRATAAPGGKAKMRVFDLRQALADCTAGTNPMLPKKYLNELKKGMELEKKILGEQYIEPLNR